MKPIRNKAIVSPEEYLEAERASEVKHEYLNGEIFAMSGAKFEHVRICGNIASNLHQQLKGTPCQTLQSDMRIHIPRTGLYTYPDVSIVCGKPLFMDESFLDTLINPDVILEVLSPSTAEYDRGPKFDHYKIIESLKEYVLVWQEKKRVARYTKRDDSNWMLTDFIGGDAIIELTSIKCVLTMEDIYAKVVFEEDSGE